MTILPHSKNSRGWLYAAALLYCVILVIGSFTVSDYGMSWDERFRFQGGDSKLEYYSDLFAGKETSAHSSSYSGLFDLPLAWVHSTFPDLGSQSQKGHVWSFCFGCLGLLSVWRLVARVGGERAGFWALLFLTALPRYYGHMFFNPKDIPLAGTYAFGLWSLVSLFSNLPNKGWKAVIWVGLAAGLAMSTRIAGFLILVYFGLFIGLYLFIEYASKRRQLALLASDLMAWALRGGVAGFLGFAVLFIFWPTLHQNPFENAANTVSNVQNFGWGGKVLMDGHFWDASDLPFYYIPYWLVYTLPEYLLVLITLGVGVGVHHTLSYLRERSFPAAVPFVTRALILFSAFFPLFYILYKDPVMYDGMRHILFTLPPLVCVAALSFEWILRRVEAISRFKVSYALQGGCALAVLIVTVEMVSLHPYQYVYFNQISGGLPAAYLRDETDYWGVSHKEAAEWLNEYVETVDLEGARIFKVHLRYSRWMLQEHLNPERFEMSKEREGADFFVSVTRFNLHASYPDAELLHVVERQGVPLCFVYDLRKEHVE